MQLKAPITYNIYDGDKLVFKTKSATKASDYRVTNGKHLSIMAIDSIGNTKKLYADGGGVGELKVGDKVELRMGGDSKRGVVVSPPSNGKVSVEVEFTDVLSKRLTKMKMAFPISSIHKLSTMANGGGVDENTQVYGKYKNNNTDDSYLFSSNSKGLDFLTNHKNIEVLSVGQGKYDLFYGWDNNKQEDGTLYFGKWNKGNFGFNYSGVIKYAKGGGIETESTLRKRFEGYTDEELQIYNGDNAETLKNWNRKDAIQEAIDAVNEEGEEEERFTYKDIYTSQGGMTFETEEEVKKFIKRTKPFIRKQLKEGNFVVVFNGKEYYIAEKIKHNEYGNGGGVDSEWTVTIVYPSDNKRSGWSSDEVVDINVLANSYQSAEQKAMDKFKKTHSGKKGRVTSVNSNTHKFLDNAKLSKGSTIKNVKDDRLKAIERMLKQMLKAGNFISILKLDSTTMLVEYRGSMSNVPEWFIDEMMLKYNSKRMAKGSTIKANSVVEFTSNGTISVVFGEEEAEIRVEKGDKINAYVDYVNKEENYADISGFSLLDILQFNEDGKFVRTLEAKDFGKYIPYSSVSTFKNANNKNGVAMSVDLDLIKIGDKYANGGNTSSEYLYSIGGL